MQNSGQAPQEQILSIIVGYWQANVLAVATKLGLADFLAEKPLSVDELAQRAGANAGALFRMLRALESIGIFTQISPRVFANSAVSELLRKDVPGSHCAGVLHQLVKGNGSYEAWHEFEYAIRTGESAIPKIYGCDFWEFLRKTPEANEAMNQAMLSLSASMAPAVTSGYDWAQFSTIVDVGGGIGSQLVSILDAFPSVKGVAFDQPHVIASALRHDRLTATGGDFFASIPSKGDAYLLRFILHDWSDEESLEILRSVRRAMKPSATLVVAEFVISEGPAPDLSKWTDLHMMVTFRHARERTQAEHRALLQAAGFALQEVIATPSPVSLLIAKPAGDGGAPQRSSSKALQEEMAA